MADEIVRVVSGGQRALAAVCTIDFASTAAAALSAAVDLDFPGARLGRDTVRLMPVGAPLGTGLFLKGYVDADDSLKVYLDNVAGANPTNLASANFWVVVEGFEPVGGPL